VFVCWDIKSVFYALWSPFDRIMGYTDPRKPTGDRMHGEAWEGLGRHGLVSPSLLPSHFLPPLPPPPDAPTTSQSGTSAPRWIAISGCTVWLAP